MLYLANPCGNEEITAAMAEGVIGLIDTPRQGNRRPPGVLWCADNGCFSERWEPAEWWRFLEANAAVAGHEAQEQNQGIAIAANGLQAHAAKRWQILTEELLHT